MPLPPLFAPVVCEVAPHQIEELAADAVREYLKGQVGPFRETVGRLQHELVCARGLMTPSQVAQVHLVFGMYNQSLGSKDAARAAFRSAWRAHPGLQLGVEFNDLDDLKLAIESARVAPAGLSKPLRVPAGTRVRVDGQDANTYPADRPFIVQVEWEVDTQVHWTFYISDGELELNLGPFAPPQPCGEDLVIVGGGGSEVVSTCTAAVCADLYPPPPPAPTTPLWLTGGAFGATLIAGGLGTWAGILNGRYEQYKSMAGALCGYASANGDSYCADHEDDLPLGRLNAATYAAYGVGAAAVALDVTVLVKGVRQRAAARDAAKRRATE